MADDRSLDVMTVAQVAEYLQINKLTVYRYIREGQLPAVRLGRAFRVMRADVQRFLEARKMPAVARGRAVSPAARARSRAAAAASPAGTETPQQGGSRGIYVGPARAEDAKPREEIVTSNPLDWVIRGLH